MKSKDNLSLPLDLSHFNKDIVIGSYSTFFKMRPEMNREDLLVAQPDATAMKKGNRCLIFYNDIELGRVHCNRYRFSIAHELGHVFLNHVSKSSSNTPYYILEKEADEFASVLLCPFILMEKLNCYSIDRVVNVFKISRKAAEVRIDKYKRARRKKGHLSKFDKAVLEVFNLERRECPVCRYSDSEDFVYCPICGSLKSTANNKGEDDMTYEEKTYEEITLDEDSKALVCPECGSGESLEGKFCSICGMYLVNECLDNGAQSRLQYNAPINPQPCGKLLKGNARYCTYCGSPSTYYVNEILKDWYNTDDANPNPQQFMDIDDEDIPF